MAVEERRRIALHRAAAQSWGEEVADTLVDLVAPSGHELATRQDIEGILLAMSAMDARWDERLAASDERLTAMDARWDERLAASDERLTAMDARWDERLAASDTRWDERMKALESRSSVELQSAKHELLGAFERRIADAVTHQTRTLVFSQLAALIVIAGLAFGLR